MSNTYVQNEMKKVLESSEYPKNMALASAWAIAHFKGINIKIFDVSEVSSLCDYNIIATAENIVQAKAMVGTIEKNLIEAGGKMNAVEGVTDGEWILLDMGDLIIHIFQDLSRSVYDLESLWKGCDQVKIPSEFYFGEGAETPVKEDNTENYF
jgi:ribosome-associated protein